MPGTDTTLAINFTASWETIGIFDITGNAGAFRPNVSSDGYNGNLPTFADASHLYAYDNETTGAEFYRYTVNAGGLTLIDDTTLDGMGVFGYPFALAGGVVYGADGGIVNPSTTPPSQIATLNTFGGEGVSVAVDAPTGKVFLVLENETSEINYSLARYSNSRFVAENFLSLPISSTSFEPAYNMLRWGQDGLALQISGYNYTTDTSNSQVLLLRGPFVLPSELGANPVPTLTAPSPATLAVTSGNTTLTLDGANFIPGAVALWAGQPRTTTYLDSGHLSVAIPASDLTTAQNVSITVQNPGTAASAAIPLSVQ